MQGSLVLLIARQFWKNAFKVKAIYPTIALVAIMIAYATYSGWKSYTVQNGIRKHYQQIVRQSWENNPDKHPHRMAHYGSFAFRLRHKMSVFDFGTESFTGNAVFLEAHRQNTVNFSEASFSTGLLRFGEISLAMLLQIVFPLIIFFLGYNAIAFERENGTLKVLLCQGAGWKEILVGKSLGLMGLTVILYIPVVVVTAILIIPDFENPVTPDILLRFAGTVFSYLLFFAIVAIIAILISAVSASSKNALIKLLAIWLLFVVLLPKTTQALGNFFYPSPSRVEFESQIEKDLIKIGDSHNPDDPYYKGIKDSLLRTYQVDSVQKLPFNYSGFVMQEGERISANIYKQHLAQLIEIYRRQNALGRVAAFFNPYMAIRNLSMALSGTDFDSYVNFQDQAEAYRYRLAQEMNELQIKLISNKKLGENDKPYSISHDHWKELPDFQYQFSSVRSVVTSELLSIVSLIVWSILSLVLISNLSKKAKAL